MNRLDEIVACKKREVAEKKELYPMKLLERSIYFNTPPLSLKTYIMRPDLNGIIAEFKRKSPSKGTLNEFAKPEQVCLHYMQAGASALSVLTDREFFGGTSDDLIAARKFNYCPILRKDFVIDEYQVVESKSIGADAILLIAEILTKKELVALSAIASSLGLEVLHEVHSRKSIDKLPPQASIVGVNNRNLNTFHVSINHAASLISDLPGDVAKVVESGITSPEMLLSMKNVGFNGFLIGEKFMREANPGKACQAFINRLNTLTLNGIVA